MRIPDGSLVTRGANEPISQARALASFILRQRLLLAISALAPSIACTTDTVTNPRRVADADADSDADADADTDSDDIDSDNDTDWGPPVDSGWEATPCMYASGVLAAEGVLRRTTGVMKTPEDVCPETPTTITWDVAPESCNSEWIYNYWPVYPWGVRISVDLLEQQGAECHYELTCNIWGSCLGRPVRQEGVPLTSQATTTDAWKAVERPHTADLTPNQREALARAWALAGCVEHSSIAGFHKLALDLMAHAAPAELIERVHRAAEDELRHARACFGLASAYGASNVGPGPLPLKDLSIPASLSELAVATAIEGAIGETIGVALARERLVRSTDPAVRTALQRIVEDESRHAELAWSILAWALEQGGEPVRVALADVFASPELPEAGGPVGLLAHGVLDAATSRAVAEECMEAVILPVAQALLADRAA